MKRAILFLAAGGILVTTILCAAATSSGPAGDTSKIDQLKQEVEMLRLRVESLENRLKDNSTLVLPHGRTMSPQTIDPNSLLRPRSAPRDWKRFEFNGLPCYIIPIEGFACPEPGK